VVAWLGIVLLLEERKRKRKIPFQEVWMCYIYIYIFLISNVKILLIIKKVPN